MSHNETEEKPKVGDGTKFPGSGRQKGTPNKKSVIPLETIRANAAAELTAAEIRDKVKDPKQYNADDITGVRILYLYANNGWRVLGRGEKSITEEMQLDAASKLANFEVPKKRAVEVTGIELTGEGGFVISTGKPAPSGETDEEFAARTAKETEQAEIAAKRVRLEELEQARAEGRAEKYPL